jgi:hypothetical protein
MQIRLFEEVGVSILNPRGGEGRGGRRPRGARGEKMFEQRRVVGW